MTSTHQRDASVAYASDHDASSTKGKKCPPGESSGRDVNQSLRPGRSSHAYFVQRRAPSTSPSSAHASASRSCGGSEQVDSVGCRTVSERRFEALCRLSQLHTSLASITNTSLRIEDPPKLLHTSGHAHEATLSDGSFVATKALEASHQPLARRSVSRVRLQRRAELDDRCLMAHQGRVCVSEGVAIDGDVRLAANCFK